MFHKIKTQLNHWWQNHLKERNHLVGRDTWFVYTYAGKGEWNQSPPFVETLAKQQYVSHQRKMPNCPAMLVRLSVMATYKQADAENGKADNG